jgi:hypothetical protein
MSLVAPCKATPKYVSLSACSKISHKVTAEDVGVRLTGKAGVLQNHAALSR